MAKRKTIKEYNEEILKAEEAIKELQARIKEKRKELKDLEDEKKAEQGQLILERFWKKDIKDFDEVEELVDSILDELDPEELGSSSDTTNKGEGH